jgi:UDP-N-acetylmuramoyl-tripeptide--D-alanyl-D-alanine ligase
MPNRGKSVADMTSMSGTMLFGWKEAAYALGGEVFVPEKSNRTAGFCAVSVDSRQIERDALFVALPGERADGHRFVEGAFKAGAAGALVRKEQVDKYALTREAERAGSVLLMVDDTLSALQLLAKAYLDKFPGLLRVGVTGSSGKTTTKEIAAAIIGREKRVVYNRANLNSDIGLPLSVFQVRVEHEAGVFELGMNRRGEIAEITGVLCPALALVTNIGTAHIGIIGTRKGIAEEKKAIFSRFTGKETALIPAGSDFAAFLAEDVKGTVRLYPGPDGVFDSVKDCGVFGWECTIDGSDGHRAVFSLPGRHNLQNAAAAVAVARALGIRDEAIAQGLSSVRPLSGRGEVVQADMGGRGVTVVNDCYNANPDSMEKALEFFAETPWTGRKIVVAGEMLELGDRSEEEHEKLFRRLEAAGADKNYFFHVSDRVFQGGEIAVYDDGERLKAALDADAREGDLVLLKGSRACALERMVL